MFRWPRKPQILPEVEVELEQNGVDAVRAFLASQRSFGGEGITRDALSRLRRGDVEDWLKWKSEIEDYWIRLVAIAAVAAVAVGYFAWVHPIR